MFLFCMSAAIRLVERGGTLAGFDSLSATGFFGDVGEPVPEIRFKLGTPCLGLSEVTFARLRVESFENTGEQGLPDSAIDCLFFLPSLSGELSMLESVWSNRGEFLDPLKADIVWLMEDILLGRRLFSLDLQSISLELGTSNKNRLKVV